MLLHTTHTYILLHISQQVNLSWRRLIKRPCCALRAPTLGTRPPDSTSLREPSGRSFSITSTRGTFLSFSLLPSFFPPFFPLLRLFCAIGNHTQLNSPGTESKPKVPHQFEVISLKSRKKSQESGSSTLESESKNSHNVRTERENPPRIEFKIIARGSK